MNTGNDQYAPLLIKPCEVKIITGNAFAYFDGEKETLTNDEYTVTGLPEGYTIEVTVVGELTKNNESVENTVGQGVIRDIDGNEVVNMDTYDPNFMADIRVDIVLGELSWIY